MATSNRHKAPDDLLEQIAQAGLADGHEHAVGGDDEVGAVDGR